MSFITGTNCELIYQNTNPGTAKNAFTTEALINDVAGMGPQACLPPYFFQPSGSVSKALLIKAMGILSTTVSPTFTWTIRLGASGTSAPIILGSAALTAGATVTNKQWYLEGLIYLKTPGAAGANSTLVGGGTLWSTAGLASPFGGELWGGAAQPGTIATVDISITNYISFNAACGTSNASNAIQLLSLSVFGLN